MLILQLMFPCSYGQGWGGPTPQLADKADVIAIGTIISQGTLLHEEGGVDTTFMLLLEEYLKGKVTTNTVNLVMMGGRHPGGRAISIGAISNEFDYFHAGDEVLLFGCFGELDEATIYQCTTGPSLYRRVIDGNGADVVVDLEGHALATFNATSYVRIPVSTADLLYALPGTIGAKLPDAMSWTAFTDEVRAIVWAGDRPAGKIWAGVQQN